MYGCMDARFEAVLRPLMVERHERAGATDWLLCTGLQYTVSCSTIHTRYTLLALMTTDRHAGGYFVSHVSPSISPPSAQRVFLVNPTTDCPRQLSTPLHSRALRPVLMIDHAVPHTALWHSISSTQAHLHISSLHLYGTASSKWPYLHIEIHTHTSPN